MAQRTTESGAREQPGPRPHRTGKPVLEINNI
jgi:hypothetical protein